MGLEWDLLMTVAAFVLGMVVGEAASHRKAHKALGELEKMIDKIRGFK